MGHSLIWMISGLADPRWLPNILDNYNRQKYKYKKLIIVENGNGIGSTKNVKLPINITILTSNHGPSQSINAGISFVRSNGNDNDWFCKCDSDDYYGPDYLSQIKKASKSGADYVGRGSLYIKSTDNTLWYIGCSNNNYIFHGPTLAANVKNAIDFPLVKNWGEDEAWCKEMHKLGRKSLALPAEGFCYQRWSDYQHTWPCTDLEIRTIWQVEVLDLGKLDFDIVNGKKTRPNGTVLEPPTIDYTNFMPLRLLRERSTNYVGF
jgi:hypothetical protein